MLLHPLKIQQRFLFGKCAEFAEYLASLYNKPIVSILDSDRTTIHFAVAYDSDTFLDASGRIDSTQLKKRYDLDDFKYIYTDDISIYTCNGENIQKDAALLCEHLKKKQLLP